MRVKRLEIQGFKSFKDKTVVHFDHAITGIVGPNGCGKSNIVDAFFWVMGEQSNKHMRASGSQDLIFNGSSKYAPLGLAEATLVLEQDVIDTSTQPAGASASEVPTQVLKKEISVTRRVYRSGEGEYRINGVPARLRDIQELFMDTGIGAKGYSIIAQGEIQKIVNAKPEERRALIEEAAGIAKYKARKKESLRKLEVAQENLGRLQDVLNEIERSLDSLERQAQKASQQKKLKDELYHLEIGWARSKLIRLRGLMLGLESYIREQSDLKAQHQSRLTTLETQAEVFQVESLDLVKRLEVLNLRATELSDTIVKSQSAAELLRERRQDFQRQSSEISDEYQTESQTLIEDKNQLLEAEEALQISGRSLEELQGQGFNQETALAEAQAKVENLRNQFRNSKDKLSREISPALADLTARENKAEVQIQSTQIQLDHLTQKLNETEAQWISQQERLVELETICSNAQNLYQLRSDEEDQLNLKKDEAVRAHNTAQRAWEEAFRETEKARSRLESLVALDASLTGYGEGTRKIVEIASAQQRAFEPISQYLTYPEQYKNAVSAVLSPLMEVVLEIQPQTDNRFDFAKTAIEQLVLSKTGVASVFVGNNRNKFADREMPQSIEGGILFSDIVSFSETTPAEVRETLASFFSKFIYYANLSDLERIYREGLVPPGSALVSKDGFSLDSRGWLRGGHAETSVEASPLERRRAIQDLNQILQDCEIRLNRLNGEKLELSESIQRFTLAIEESAEASSHAQTSMLELQGQLQAEKQNDVRIRNEIDRDKQDFAKLEAQIQEWATTMEIIQNDLSSRQQERELLEAQLKNQEVDLLEREQFAQDLQKLYFSFQLELERARDKVQSGQREVESYRNRVLAKERKIEQLRVKLEKLESDLENLAQTERGLEDISDSVVELSQCREHIGSEKNRYEILQTELKAINVEQKSIQTALSKAVQGESDSQIQLSKHAVETDFLVQNIEERYGVGSLEVPTERMEQSEFPDPIVSGEMSEAQETEAQTQIEQIRERIRRLGDVNPGALEEFTQQSERHAHLLAERKDLQTSIDQLLEAIEYINKTSIVRFEKTFEAIANRFEKLFPIVFGGGQAKLSLVFEEGQTDILEAGVDIFAQPPGKKIVNMTLLSGGEKALTAVSLIFAIFMVKPSPFCILDEVDAPLDDANIGKFNALLKEMSSKSQFILITHNKKTMELNDTLYGVTMEEPGVSKMISVELSEAPINIAI